MPKSRAGAWWVVSGLALAGCVSGAARAGVTDCLKVAVNAANPAELEKAASFARRRTECLAHFVPPRLVPFVALSGAINVANQSGALRQVGMEFPSGDEARCRAQLDPARIAGKQLGVVLKPACAALGQDCSALDSAVSAKGNDALAAQLPIIEELPCACSAATSGLGVERLVELAKDAQQCGATVAEVAEAITKAADSVVGVGSALVSSGLDTVSGLASGIASGVGCTLIGCDSPPAQPMPADVYFHLLFSPTIPKLLLMRSENPAEYARLLDKTHADCLTFYSHWGSDNGVCALNSQRLHDAVEQLHVAITRKADNYYALQVAPTLEGWAFTHFGQGTAGLAAQHAAQCRAAVNAAFPLPSPTLRCEEGVAVRKNTLAEAGSAKADAQCRAEQQSWVLAPVDAVAVAACEPIVRKVEVAPIGAMGKWRKRMDRAAAAGCGNAGMPGSVHCPDFASFSACRKAVPDARQLCADDAGMRLSQGVLETLYLQSKQAGKPQRCVRLQGEVRCSRPQKQQYCASLMARHANEVDMPAQPGLCTLLPDAAYVQQMRQAEKLIGILNVVNSSSPVVVAAKPKIRPVGQAAPAQGEQLRGAVSAATMQRIRPDMSQGNCELGTSDRLEIHCKDGFVWDADPRRAQAVIAVLGGPLQPCALDPEGDGADQPCLVWLAAKGLQLRPRL